MTNETFTSPVCALNEAPDQYLGYLPSVEIAARIGGMAKLAGKAGNNDLQMRLEMLCRDLPQAAPVPPGTEIAAALDSLLPKVRDDRLHAALKAIRDSLG